MRFLNGALAFFIALVAISYMKASGVVVFDDASIISIAIVVAGALAGGD